MELPGLVYLRCRPKPRLLIDPVKETPKRYRRGYHRNRGVIVSPLIYPDLN